MMVSGVFGLIVLNGFDASTGILTGLLYTNATNYILTTVPTFVLMATLLQEADVIQDVFSAIHVWTRHIRAGLAITTTLANGLMAALSGSSTAVVAALASTSVPEMRKYNYDDQLSVGTVAAAGTFAIMIPPSLGLIIFGVITETNIGDLFIAGIIPGLLTILVYIITILLWDIKSDVAGDKLPRSSWNDRISSTKVVVSATLLMAIVIGGLYSGIMTPTESGGVGAFGAFLILVIERGGRMGEIKQGLQNAIELTVMIFVIILGAFVFSTFVAVTGFTDFLIGLVINMPLGSTGILIVILIVYISLGTMMDQLAILVLTLPITYPLLVFEMGYHPVWVGIIIVKTIEIGVITPPLGLNVYVATSPIDVSVDTAFRGASKFLIGDIMLLFLLIIFPGIVTFLI